jgi:hypothetical protein
MPIRLKIFMYAANRLPENCWWLLEAGRLLHLRELDPETLSPSRAHRTPMNVIRGDQRPDQPQKELNP